MDLPLAGSAMKQIERATIQQLVTKLLQRKGMFAAEAEIVAERMIEADLQHRASDGAGTLPQYLESIDLGDIDPRARFITVSETASVALLDGGTGMGHVAATRGMQIAIEKARQVGTGTVVIRNSRPAGDLGGIASLASKMGMIGLVTTSFDEGIHSQDANDLAWSIPAAEGLQPIVQRERRQNLGAAAIIMCGLLTAGLAGADLAGHKRKASRASNLVEYYLLAIDPAQFGSRDALLEKWRPLWKADSEEQPTEGGTPDGTTVAYSTADADLLAALAAKIKFAVTW